MQLRSLVLIPLLALSLGAGPCVPAGGPDAGPPPPDAPPTPDEVPGCDGAVFRGNPFDASARGPSPVGARTVTLGELPVEVWYPAAAGSDTGPALVYDLREQLPPTERGKIPDDDAPWQTCDCQRDLPLDAAHGPYPVIVFVHGTASFRHQSLSQVTHWASRGFVVIAADHPGLRLGHALANLCPGNPRGSENLSGDIDALLAAIASPSGDLGFLAGKIDATRVAIIGHSAGGNAAAELGNKPGVRLIGVLAGRRASSAGGDLQHALYMGGKLDTVVRWADFTTGYNTSTAPRTMIGLDNAGHLAFSDLCETRNAQGQNLIAIANEHGICGAPLAGLLFDCNQRYLDGPTAWSIIDDATSSLLEPVLQCRAGLPPLGEIRSRHPQISDYAANP